MKIESFAGHESYERIKNMNKSYDSKFEAIDGLAWYPWHTNSYAGITILGESCYGGWEKSEEERGWLKSKDFVRNRIAGPALNGQPDEPIYRNLERAIFNRNHIDKTSREKFWNSVAFYNIVQRVMPTISARPTRKDFAEGWLIFDKVNSILNSNTVIVIGTQIEKVQTFRQYVNSTGKKIINEIWSDVKNGNGFEYAFELDHGTLSKVVFIKHTSKFFSWEKCSGFLSKVDISKLFY